MGAVVWSYCMLWASSLVLFPLSYPALLFLLAKHPYLQPAQGAFYTVLMVATLRYNVIDRTVVVRE